jgi:hypothetical protein
LRSKCRFALSGLIQKSALEIGMSNETVARLRTPPLPATREDLIAGRKSMRTRSLNDDVEDLHLKLWNNELYRQYLIPIWREDTIEGTFGADDLMAAKLIRDSSSSDETPLARKAKLMSIVHSLHVVCKRYGISRKERQQLAGTLAGIDACDADDNQE